MSILKHVCAAVLFVSAVMVLSAAADAQTYGGRGIGVAASVTNNGSTSNYVFADTGQLPSQGGNITISAPSSFISGVMSTGVLTASTSGALRSSQSVTVANDVDIIIGGVRIRANRATANAGCICCPGVGDGTCGGSSAFNALTITDQASGATTSVTVTGQPNQVVNLPNGIGTLTLNQQITGATAITVNAMHVEATANGTAYNVVVASASASIECLTLNPTAADVTVSGRVLDAAGRGLSRATVTLTDGAGNVRTASTNTLGYFSFAEVEAGASYILQATARGYTFSSKVISVQDDTTVEIRAN
ncbi:MAG: carboxypeptidase-like regulatory domain-containing protein [Pyrinomonadaceae bacterium]